jgi:hypothetical protein
MGVSGQRHAPAALYPRGKDPVIHCTEDWVCPRAGLDSEARGRIFCLCRWSNLYRPVVQPVARHYTDWVILLTKLVVIHPIRDIPNPYSKIAAFFSSAVKYSHSSEAETHFNRENHRGSHYKCARVWTMFWGRVVRCWSGYRERRRDLETRHGFVTSRTGAISTVRVELVFVATVVVGGAEYDPVCHWWHLSGR